MIKTILKFKRKYKICIPYSEQSLMSYLYNNYSVEGVEYLDIGVSAVATLDEKKKKEGRRFLLSCKRNACKMTVSVVQ